MLEGQSNETEKMRCGNWPMLVVHGGEGIPLKAWQKNWVAMVSSKNI